MRNEMIHAWLDLAAVVVGALAGVLVAQERKLDLVGYVGMCIICALGGGLLRDAIMQVGDVYALNSRWPIILCVITGLVGFVFPSLVKHFPKLYEWVDILSVALFVVAGASKALAYELHASATILMGVITGVGGGMLRDVFLGEVPHVFKKSNFYAISALVGSICYYLCVRIANLNPEVAAAITVLAVLVTRRLSLRYNIESPTEVGLEDKVRKTKHRITRKLEDKRADEQKADK